MSGCEAIGILFHVFNMLLTLMHFQVGGLYLYIQNQILQSVPNPGPGQAQLLSYITYYTSSEAAMYFIGACVALVVSLYCLLASTCDRRSKLQLKTEFFLTVIAFCLQVTLGVRSSINLVVFQQTFEQFLTSTSAGNMQALVIGESYLMLPIAIPVMVALLHHHWKLLFIYEQQREKIQEMEMMVKRRQEGELQAEIGQ